MTALDEIVKHKNWCGSLKFWRSEPTCDCGVLDALEELASLRSTLEAKEQTIRERDGKIAKLIMALEDVNDWLKRTDRKGTAHQIMVEAVLRGEEL